MNSVLDDNKILTLANGDRVPMIDNVKLMFEVEDLRNASPATVSRAGIIYVSESDLDWEPVLRSWLNRKSGQIAQLFADCFKKYIGVCDGPKSFGHLFHFLSKSCRPVIQSSRVGMIEGCCNLLDGLLEIADLTNNHTELRVEVERLFLFAITWGIGGLLETEDRIKFSDRIFTLDDSGKMVPGVKATSDTIFEYRVNTDSMEWERWVAPHWDYPVHTEEPDFSNMLVPTIETTRSSFLLRQIHKQKKSVMITGGSGTAKTSNILMFLDTIGNEKTKLKKICLSSATSPHNFQSTIEAELDKRGGKSFGPPSGKQMTVFIDDLYVVNA